MMETRRILGDIDTMAFLAEAEADLAAGRVTRHTITETTRAALLRAQQATLDARERLAYDDGSPAATRGIVLLTEAAVGLGALRLMVTILDEEGVDDDVA